MSDDDMTVVYVFAGVWCLTAVAATAIIVYGIYKTRPERGQGAPKWTPDPAFDPDVDAGLEQDDEVAELDALFYSRACGVSRGW